MLEQPADTAWQQRVMTSMIHLVMGGLNKSIARIPHQVLLMVRRLYHPSRETHDIINMSKICLPPLDLQRRALAEIRRMPGCHNVQEIAINRVTDEAVDFNWSLCVLSSGTADANTAARAAIHVQNALRLDYDLLID